MAVSNLFLTDGKQNIVLFYWTYLQAVFWFNDFAYGLGIGAAFKKIMNSYATERALETRLNLNATTYN